MDNVPYEIDGQNFTSLAEFYEEIGRILIPGQDWGKNLDSFNDILFWPSEENGRRYTLIWKNSALSGRQLGHEAMVQKLENMLRVCHPLNIPSIRERALAARQGSGPTLFEWLVEIISENEQYVELRLE